MARSRIATRTPTDLTDRIKSLSPTPALPDPTAIPNQNMGRLQHAPPEWSDGGSGGGWMHSNEISDKQEREAYGLPLPAAYRHLIGPAPQLPAGDREGARVYWLRIEAAAAQGGWTRSEWRRLRKLRAKWKTRAHGDDPRFELVGNRRGGVTGTETAEIKQRRIVAGMMSILDRGNSGRRNEGD